MTEIHAFDADGAMSPGASLAFDAYRDTDLDARYRRNVTPADYGAIGDGLADDTQAVRDALLSGHPLYWGGHDAIYRVTEPIEITLTRPLVWTSKGASIRGDLPSVAAYLVTVHADSYDVDVRGLITIDAGKTAHTCIRFWNRRGRASFVAEDLRATRAHRSVAGLAGGDGIEVAGAWDRVYLIRPTVTDISMSAGAGVSGSLGVSGIYVHEINKAGGADVPHDVQIIDPQISEIYSEDPAHKVDQDGMRLFGKQEISGDGAASIPTRFLVHGGEIRNALGRSIKAQTPYGTVDGVKFVRTRGGTGATHEIDFQVGGGSVRDIECLYQDAAPLSVVNFSGERDNATVVQSVLAGARVTLSGTATLSRVVSVAALGEILKSVSVRDAIVKGGTPDNMVAVTGISGGRAFLAVSGVIGAVANAFVSTSGGSPGGWTLDLAGASCINTSMTPMPFAKTATSLAVIESVKSSLVRLT